MILYINSKKFYNKYNNENPQMIFLYGVQIDKFNTSIIFIESFFKNNLLQRKYHKNQIKRSAKKKQNNLSFLLYTFK